MKQPRTHLKALILALAAIGSPGLLYAEGTNEAQPAQGQEQQADSTDSAAEAQASPIAKRMRPRTGSMMRQGLSGAAAVNEPGEGLGKGLDDAVETSCVLMRAGSLTGGPWSRSWPEGRPPL